MILRSLFVALAGAALAGAQQPAPDTQAAASVSGRIVAVGGQPLRKANVTLRQTGGGWGSGGSVGAFVSGSASAPQGMSTTSDAEGNFLFDNVAPGRYQLWVERAGYLRQTYGAKRSLGMGTMLTVTPGHQIKDLVVELTAQGMITGKVVDEDGDPVARSNIMVMTYLYANGRRQLMPRGGQMTDDNGEYKVTGLSPGRYYLSAGHPQTMFATDTTPAAPAKADKPVEDYVTTWYPNGLDSASATPIDVVAGQTAAGIDVRLRKSAVVNIKGTVSFAASDAGSQRLRVQLVPKDSFSFGMSGRSSSAIAKDGSFAINRVAPGSYTLNVTSMEGMVQTEARQPIEVGDRNIDGVTITVQPPIEIRGTVKVEGDDTKKVSGGRVMLSPADGGMMINPSSAAIRDDGTFVISPIAPAKYRVTAFANVQGAYLKAVRYGNQDVLPTGIDLSGGGGGTLEVVYSTKGAEVSGTVQADGQPVQSGTITLIPDPPTQDQMRYRQTSVDQNGQFDLRDVAPGDYRVYAWEDLEAGNQYDPDFLKPLEGNGARISVGENGHEQVTLNRISMASVEEAQRKNGR